MGSDLLPRHTGKNLLKNENMELVSIMTGSKPDLNMDPAINHTTTGAGCRQDSDPAGGGALVHVGVQGKVWQAWV